MMCGRSTMIKTFVFIVLVAAVSVSASTKRAIAVLKNGDIDGTITFTEENGAIRITGTIRGLPEGKHGFHVHEKGDLSNGCTSTGSHFNPHNKTHGAPGDDTRHVGDLGNIEANSSKTATINILDKVISLGGEHCILGRAIVVHADPDDLGKGNQSDSLTTGHAGARLACAIIGIA